MKTKGLVKAIKGAVGSARYVTKKNLPKILTVFGGVGVFAGFVIGCVETTKLEGVIEQSNNEIEAIKNDISDPAVQRRELTAAYGRAAWNVTKLYAPGVIITGLSVASMVSGNRILMKRNIELGAAYAGAMNTYKRYRNNVIEELGAEADERFRTGAKRTTISETKKDKNGNDISEKRKVNVLPENYDDVGEFSRIFDELNDHFDRDDPDFNIQWLTRMERLFNEKLATRKIIFLNDVLVALGFPKTKAGQIVGWKWGPEYENGTKYLSFGINDIRKQAVRNFRNCYEKAVVLNFNVDGDVWSTMGSPRH